MLSKYFGQRLLGMSNGSWESQDSLLLIVSIKIWQFHQIEQSQNTIINYPEYIVVTSCCSIASLSEHWSLQGRLSSPEEAQIHRLIHQDPNQFLQLF
jgi:hypothetical protein